MKTEQEQEPLVDANKIGEFLDITPRAVMDLARAGTIPRVKLSGKVIRFRLSAVARAIHALEGGE